MRFLSVCSGIEAASVAWAPLGWRAAAFAEIEPFPCALLAHRFPEVPNFGDMTRFEEWPDVGPIDLLCGGTPCQSFSVAGKRGGLDDPRGDLMLTFGAIARRYQPRWIVWENVPGVLSSDGGRDFGAFLGLLVECGYGFAYRVLDAQYFGVPQRRRRVFVVGCLGDWRAAAAVLFERHCLQGHPGPRREAGEGITGAVTTRLAASSGQDLAAGFAIPALARCVTAGEGRRQDSESCTFVTHTLTGNGFDASEDGTGRGTPLVPTFLHCNKGRPNGRASAHTEMVTLETEVVPTLTTAGHAGSAIAFSCKDHGADAGDLAPTLRAMGHAGSHANAGGQVAVAFGWQNSPAQGDSVSEHVTPTLDKSKTPAICFQERGRKGGRWLGVGGDVAFTLTAPSGGGRAQERNIAHGSSVRRLTPRECERLQGFPDDWTAVPFRGKPAADGPRYKALGNSWAVPCARWIGERIAAVEAILADARAAA